MGDKKTMRYWLCHYVNRDDPGDLLWGFNWRPAVLVDDFPDLNGYHSHEEYEERMFDAETGENVGDTRNYCIDPHCWDEGCGPMTLIAEVSGEQSNPSGVTNRR